MTGSPAILTFVYRHEGWEQRVIDAAEEMRIPWSITDGVLEVAVNSAQQAFELGVRSARVEPLPS